MPRRANGWTRTAAGSRTTFALALLLALAPLSRSHADSIGPFQNFRQVDPTGKYDVVVKRDLTVQGRHGTPVVSEFAERKPGSAPIRDACDSARRDNGSWITVASPDVNVRDAPAAKPDLLRIFADQNRPAEIRMKAAVALARLGDRRGQVLAKDMASSHPYALKSLPYLFGDSACAMVIDCVKRSKRYDELAARQAMWLIKTETAVPALVDMLKSAQEPECMRFALQCLCDKGPEAAPAVSEIVNVLDADAPRKAPTSNQRLAARALGSIGERAAVSLRLLVRLAKRYAAREWESARTGRLTPRSNFGGEPVYSLDDFVNAICRIRSNTAE